MRQAIFPFLYLLLAFSCTAQKTVLIKSLSLGDNHTLLLLDSTQAATVILQDKTDRFFDLVTPCEMSIQMKQPLKADQDRKTMLARYQQFLREDVESFTPEESVMVAEVMQSIFDNCKAVSSTIFPDTLIIIKTKGNHYGSSVYYTRENTIVVPANVLNPRMRTAFDRTMYHELFHVYSRLNPDVRKRLYQLIGFESLGLDKLDLPEGLAARVLYNPDGVDFAQRIKLQLSPDSTVWAVPVLFSRELGFQPGRRMFFAYVDFSLYQIEQGSNGRWQVLTGPNGYSSTLNMRDFAGLLPPDQGQYQLHYSPG